MPAPEVDVDGVENTEDSEPPADRVDNNFFTSSGKLEEHGAEQQKVDQGPDPECHGCRGEVCLFGRGVHVVGASDRVDIGSEREEEDDDVGELRLSQHLYLYCT